MAKKPAPDAVPGTKKYAAAHPKTVVGNGVKPGTAPSPIKPLKLPGATDVKVGGLHVGTVNVAALRNYLRNKGYALPKTSSGVAGSRLLSALNDWGVSNLPAAKFGGKNALGALLGKYHSTPNADSGRQKPQVWNTSLGVGTKVGKPVNTLIDRGGNPIPQANGQYDPSVLGGAAAALGNTVPIDEALAKSGANIYGDPAKLADALAGMQYDSQLRDLAQQRDVNVKQTDQNTHDIGSWYDQALKSLGVAGTRDKAITQAGQDSVKSADAAILASLGGAASGGATTVGSAQAQSEGTLAALGATQDQYNQDVQPIVTQERAGQLTGERAKGTQRALDLATAIANAKAQRGGSVVQNLMDIRDKNNAIRENQLTRLLQIKDANQRQDQQSFQNSLAVQQANLAALATGAKIAGGRYQKPAKGSFADTPASVKAQIAQTIFAGLDNAKPTNPAQAQAIVRARLQAAGWNMANPTVGQYGTAILNNWQQSTQPQQP